MAEFFAFNGFSPCFSLMHHFGGRNVSLSLILRKRARERQRASRYSYPPPLPSQKVTKRRGKLFHPSILYPLCWQPKMLQQPPTFLPLHFFAPPSLALPCGQQKAPLARGEKEAILREKWGHKRGYHLRRRHIGFEKKWRGNGFLPTTVVSLTRADGSRHHEERVRLGLQQQQQDPLRPHNDDAAFLAGAGTGGGFQGHRTGEDTCTQVISPTLSFSPPRLISNLFSHKLSLSPPFPSASSPPSRILIPPSLIPPPLSTPSHPGKPS